VQVVPGSELQFPNSSNVIVKALAGALDTPITIPNVATDNVMVLSHGFNFMVASPRQC
jgi:hypothetical protein